MAKPDGRAVTKKDIRGIVTEIVNDAAELILGGIEKMFEQQKKTFDRRFRKLEAGHSDLKRQLNDLKVDTPSRRQFEDLKDRVEKHHPLSG